jgi:hypothetical protein
MFRVLNVMAAMAVIVASLLIFSGHAYAHERRNVGPYQLVVGWLNEPAFAGLTNAATVRVTDPRENPAKPVEGLEKTLKLEVITGGLAPFTGPLRAVFGQAGLYALDMLPTKAGQFRYKLTGTIGTTNVSETFESSPTTFNDIQDTTSLQYPPAEPLDTRLDAIRSTADQTRLIALVAVVLGIVALGVSLSGRRRS